MPVVLPADHVRQARVHDLVDQHDVAEQHHGRISSSTHGHAGELRPGLVQQGLGAWVGDQADDAADEGGDAHVEHARPAAEQEQASDQPALLAEIVPVERPQATQPAAPRAAGRWGRAGFRRGGA